MTSTGIPQVQVQISDPAETHVTGAFQRGVPLVWKEYKKDNSKQVPFVTFLKFMLG